jgi:hypothetical protein
MERISDKGVENCCGSGICMGVYRWKAIVSVLCLAVWLPATQHCRLENLPGLGFLRCPGDTDEKSGCAGDSCDTVEKGNYKPSDHERVVPAPVCLAMVCSLELCGDIFQKRDPCFEVSTFPPPDLPKGWQFLTRTASPPRAPSLAS